MLNSLAVCWRCGPSPTTPASIFRREFSSTLTLLKAKKQVNKIRIPSKRAAAAKAKRKALLAEKAVDRSEWLPYPDALAVLRAVEVAHPNSILNLYVKAEVGNGVAIPKGRLNLPREVKAMTQDTILVFAEGRQAEDAKKAGAHIIGGLELIDGIINHRHKATTILCTPALIRAITPKLGRFLGPLGLMPSERRGTVTDDIGEYIQRMRGTSEWKADPSGNIHMPIAKVHFPVEDIMRNIKYFMSSVKRVTGNTKEAEDSRKLKNSGAKPLTKISKVILSSRHGPGIRILDPL